MNDKLAELVRKWRETGNAHVAKYQVESKEAAIGRARLAYASELELAMKNNRRLVPSLSVSLYLPRAVEWFTPGNARCGIMAPLLKDASKLRASSTFSPLWILARVSFSRRFSLSPVRGLFLPLIFLGTASG